MYKWYCSITNYHCFALIVFGGIARRCAADVSYGRNIQINNQEVYLCVSLKNEVRVWKYIFIFF